jgi:hypothetical protein
MLSRFNQVILITKNLVERRYQGKEKQDLEINLYQKEQKWDETKE